MGSFDDFIRYGLPGYLIILTISWLAYCLQVIPSDPIVYKDFSGFIGAMLVILGPLLGFLIHQIYFIYFDWRESYTKPSRGCIGLMMKKFREMHPNSSISNHALQKNAFLSWKFLTTNYETNFRVDELFIKRLRSLRNYSHSFGSIITANLISLIFIFSSLFFCNDSKSKILILAFAHLLSLLLFVSKRIEVLRRINELEITIVALAIDTFIDYVAKLIALEQEYHDYYSMV